MSSVNASSPGINPDVPSIGSTSPTSASTPTVSTEKLLDADKAAATKSMESTPITKGDKPLTELPVIVGKQSDAKDANQVGKVKAFAEQINKLARTGKDQGFGAIRGKENKEYIKNLGKSIQTPSTASALNKEEVHKDAGLQEFLQGRLNAQKMRNERRAMIQSNGPKAENLEAKKEPVVSSAEKGKAHVVTGEDQMRNLKEMESTGKWAHEVRSHRPIGSPEPPKGFKISDAKQAPQDSKAEPPLREPISNNEEPVILEMIRAPSSNSNQDSSKAQIAELKNLLSSLNPKTKLDINADGKIEPKAWTSIGLLQGKGKESQATMSALLKQVESLANEGNHAECLDLLHSLTTSAWGKAVLQNSSELQDTAASNIAKIFLALPEKNEETNQAFNDFGKDRPVLILNEKMALEAVKKDDKRATPEAIDKGALLLAALTKEQLKNGKGTMNVNSEFGNTTFITMIESLLKKQTCTSSSEKLLKSTLAECHEQARIQAGSMIERYSAVYTNQANLAKAVKEFPDLIRGMPGDTPVFIDGAIKGEGPMKTKLAGFYEQVKTPGKIVDDNVTMALARSNPVKGFEQMNGRIIDPPYGAASQKLQTALETAKKGNNGEAVAQLEAEMKNLRALKKQVEGSIDPAGSGQCDIDTMRQFFRTCEFIINR